MKIFTEFFAFIYFTYAKFKTKSIGKNCRVNKYSVFSSSTIIKNNCHFNGCKILGKGDVVFNNNFHSGPNLLLITDYHDYKNGELPYGRSIISKNITIEKNVWVGRNVTILGGVTIGEGSIIQAGSVVVRDTNKLSISGGNPAKQFSSRNDENYKSRIK